MKGSAAIYSLGTSNRTPSEFLDLLRSHDVELVVDVRRFPSSRFEHFKREELARLLGQRDLAMFIWGRSWEDTAAGDIRPT